MTKQSASKKKTEASRESPVVKPEKPCLKPKKMGSEIDEIFAGKKRKRPEMETNTNAQNPAKVSGANAKSHRKTRKGRNGTSKASTESAFSDSTSRSRKKTADGLAVYTEEELGIGDPEAGVHMAVAMAFRLSYSFWEYDYGGFMLALVDSHLPYLWKGYPLFIVQP